MNIEKRERAEPAPLTDETRVLLHQGADELDLRADEYDAGGTNSLAEGCRASSHAIRALAARPAPPTLPIEIYGKLYDVPIPVQIHLVSLEDQLAARPAPTVPEDEPNTDVIFQSADVHAIRSMENGNRLFDRGGLVQFAREMFRKNFWNWSPAPTVPSPTSQEMDFVHDCDEAGTLRYVPVVHPAGAVATLPDAARDTERLDWLDTVNARTNKHYGTTYGWRFDLNHNRAALTDHNLPALSVRQALDAAIGAREASSRSAGDRSTEGIGSK